MRIVNIYLPIYQIIAQKLKLFQVEFYEVSVERRWIHGISYSFTSRMGIKIVRNRKRITKSHYYDWNRIRLVSYDFSEPRQVLQHIVGFACWHHRLLRENFCCRNTTAPHPHSRGTCRAIHGFDEKATD